MILPLPKDIGECQQGGRVFRLGFTAHIHQRLRTGVFPLEPPIFLQVQRRFDETLSGNQQFPLEQPGLGIVRGRFRRQAHMHQGVIEMPFVEGRLRQA